ncbi:MAG: hypothetical protein RLZZ628_865 [Bacteroidota bacterium]|jgi:hypothetical protein
MAEQEDDLIQPLAVKELRAISQKSIPISFEIADTQEDLDEISLTMDAYIQNLQLKALKQLVSNSFILQNIHAEALEHKAKLTGLDKYIILLIEKQKESATLSQIMTYCKKLNIPFKTFLPELYV